MIPLMYILNTDEIYTHASGIITKITPSYSHYRHSIQVEFKYNLDEFFFIEIYLNEFDQPSKVSLYGFYGSESIEISDLVDEYHLSGKKVSVIMSRDVILEIANNVVTHTSFLEGTTIEFKVIQDKQEVEDRAKVTSIRVMPTVTEVTINGIRYSYEEGTKATGYMPTLNSAGVKREPDVVDGHYNIFHLDGDNDGLSFLAIPPQDIDKHYLFRQNSLLAHIDMDGNDMIVGGTSYRYNNGMIKHFGMVHSMQEFLILKKNEEYKTYIFNAARDKNLYSEISLLFPAVQHNSMTVYDLRENILIKGQATYHSEIDVETDKLLFHITIDNCIDFFGRRVNKIFEFRVSPEKILSSNAEGISNATELGTFYVIDKDTGEQDVIPTDGAHIDMQKDGYMTGSNNKYSFSINKKSLVRNSNLMRGQYTTFKAITADDYLSPMYRFDEIDFNDNTIQIKNGTKTIKTELFNSSKYLISTQNGKMSSRDVMTEFGGVEFTIAPEVISSSGINITNFSDYIMLCRMVETPEYGIIGVRRDTRDLLYSIVMSYNFTDIAMVYNINLDKVYYIDFSRKEVSDNVNMLPSTFDTYISTIDEEKLKAYLRDGGFATFKAINTPNSSLVTLEGQSLFSEEVMHEKYLDSSRNMSSLAITGSGVVDASVIAKGNAIDGTYISRPGEISVMKAGFGKNRTIFRKVSNGVYSNENIDIESVSVSGSTYTIGFSHEGDSHSASISIDGGPIEVKKGLKHSLVDDSESFEYMTGFTYSSTVPQDNIFQKSGVLVMESYLGIGLAFDINTVEDMINSSSIGLHSTVSLSYDSKMIMISGIEADTVSVSDSVFSSDGLTIDLDSPTGSAYALSFNGDNGEISTTIPSDDYDAYLTAWEEDLEDNGFTEINEYESGSLYAIAFDITKAQYLQFKE